MEYGILFKGLVIVGVIMVIVFLSQQPSFSTVGKGMAENSIVRQIWDSIDTRLQSFLPDQVSGGVQENLNSLGQKITEEKHNFFQNIWKNINDYLAEKFSNISGTQVQ